MMEHEKIFQAIRLGDFSTYSDLIYHCTDINVTNDFNQNFLHEAVGNQQFEIGKDLINKKINVNHQDNDGQTPLHYAALYNDLALANLIISSKGNVNISDEHGNNALWTATFNARGSYSMVKLFLNAGGNAFDKNKYGKSPIDFAKQIEDDNLLALLNGLA